jgi:hypothetical protein
LTALQTKLAEGEQRLRDALLAGAPTSAIRQALSSIRVELAREVQNAEAAIADAAQTEAHAVAERTKLIAAEAIDRVTRKLAAFDAPEHHSKKG